MDKCCFVEFDRACNSVDSISNWRYEWGLTGVAVTVLMMKTPINLLLLFVSFLQHHSISASLKNSIAAVIGAYKTYADNRCPDFLNVALALILCIVGIMFGPIVSCMCFVAYHGLFR